MLVIALARYFTKFPFGLRKWKDFLPPVLMLVGICLPILKEPNLGTAVLIGLAMLALCHIAGAKFRHLLAVVALAVLLLPVKSRISPISASTSPTGCTPPRRPKWPATTRSRSPNPRSARAG